MNRKTAVEMKEASLDVIRALSKLVQIGNDHLSNAEFAEMKKFIGVTIGEVDQRVLMHIYKQYPDLDDLAGN